MHLEVKVLFIFVFKVESGYVCEGDHKTIAKAIKDRVSLISRKRAQRQQVFIQEKHGVTNGQVYNEY